jgi:hypothetical protein
MLSSVLKDRFNKDMASLLVCDDWPLVHFLQNGQVIQTLRAPSVMNYVRVLRFYCSNSLLKSYESTKMCAGNFLTAEGLRRFKKESKRLAGSFKLDSQQVLFAGQDGNIYIMIDFEVCNDYKTQ